MSFYEQEKVAFNNQYAAVTGGASGIGLQTVKFLLNRGAMKVAVLDAVIARDSCRRLVGEYGKERILLIRCDVTSETDMENAFKTVLEQFTKLDIFINNAGIMNDHAWEKEIATNLNGTIRGTLLGIKYMSKAEGRNGGTIINISSLAGLQPLAGCPIYSAASAAIISFTEALSKPFHYNTTGIRMMNICPGATYTSIISGASKKMLTPEIGREWLNELSSANTQKPENVAAGIVHMLLHGKNGSTWVSEGGKNIYDLNSSSLPSLKTSPEDTRTL